VPLVLQALKELLVPLVLMVLMVLQVQGVRQVRLVPLVPLVAKDMQAHKVRLVQLVPLVKPELQAPSTLTATLARRPSPASQLEHCLATMWGCRELRLLEAQLAQQVFSKFSPSKALPLILALVLVQATILHPCPSLPLVVNQILLGSQAAPTEDISYRGLVWRRSPSCAARRSTRKRREAR